MIIVVVVVVFVFVVCVVVAIVLVVVVDDGWISFACKDGERDRGNLEKGCWLNMS